MSPNIPMRHLPPRGHAPRCSGARGARIWLDRAGVAAGLRRLGAVERVNALAAKPPHFAPKAKSVIFLFMVGAPSHIDTFDPKPALEKYDGQLLPPSYGTVVSEFTKGDTPLLKSPWKFNKYGQCGREVSTLFPHHGRSAWTICASCARSTPRAPCMRPRCTR